MNDDRDPWWALAIVLVTTFVAVSPFVAMLVHG